MKAGRIWFEKRGIRLADLWKAVFAGRTRAERAYYRNKETFETVEYATLPA